MTGVDPLRLGEVRRRVAVVKSYLALEEPTDAHRKDHAEQLGLSVNQFLALVRAWREHGRAVAMSGAGAAKGTPSSQECQEPARGEQGGSGGCDREARARYVTRRDNPPGEEGVRRDPGQTALPQHDMEHGNGKPKVTRRGGAGRYRGVPVPRESSR